MLTFADFFEQKNYDNPAGIDVFVADSTDSLYHIADELETSSVPFTHATTLGQVADLLDTLHTAALEAHGQGQALDKETFLFLNTRALDRTASEKTLLQLHTLSGISRAVKLNILSFIP